MSQVADDSKLSAEAANAAAAAQIAAGAAGIPSAPPEQDIASELAARQAAHPAGITDVDIPAMLAMIQGLQARVDSMEADRAAGNAPPVKATAETIRDLLTAHANHNPGADFTAVKGLADDLVDAAGNAADSGDGAALTAVAGKLERAVAKVHPGPGDHHYLTQALGFIRDHLPDVVDRLVPPVRPAAAVGSGRAPAKVIAGSVTG